METKTIIAMLLMAGLASATDVTCVPFSGTTSISSGVVVVDIYTDYLCTSSIFTGGFTYAGKGWQVTLGNCTTASSLNLTEYETYYYKYLINGVATSDGSCHSFIATNPTNGTTSVNNYFSGASITNLNVTNNITNNITTTINITNNITTTINITNNITNNITGSSNWTDIFNFPVACNAGEAVTKINTTLTCSPFLTAETDPIWTAEKVNYTATANLPVYNNGSSNLTLAQVAANIGNWTADKPSYTTTANLPVYNNGSVTSITAGTGLTGGAITASGTIALNDTYVIGLCPIYNNGSSNLTMSDVVAGVGNWTADKGSYAPYSAFNNLSLTDITASIGNWTADKPDYTTTANLPVYNNLSGTDVGTLMINNTIIRASNTSWITANQLTYNNGTLGSTENNTINALVTSNNTTNQRIDTLNTTKLQNGSSANLSNLYVDNNITAYGYLMGQPLLGMLGSGLIESTNNAGSKTSDINISCTGLSCTYQAFKVRIMQGTAAQFATYCTIPNGTLVVPDNTFATYYVATNCTVVQTTYDAWFSTVMKNGGAWDFAYILTQNGDAEVIDSISLEQRRMMKQRILNY